MRRAAICVSIALGVPLATAYVRASECDGPQIRADSAVQTRWPKAIAELRDHLEKLKDVDRCARIDLVVAGAEVVVLVTLKDGRSAIRRISHAEEVSVTVDALLMLPQSGTELSPGASAGSTSSSLAPSATAAPSDPRSAASNPAPRPETHSYVEFGVAVATRLAGRTLFLGVGIMGFAQLELRGWLLGVNARSDFTDRPVGGTETPRAFRMHNFGIGMGLGRRIPVGRIDLDVLAGLALIEQLQSGETSADVESSGFDTDGRAVVAVRVSKSGSNALRVYASLDLEAWRHRREHAPAPLPDWPNWSLGLGVGLTWTEPSRDERLRAKERQDVGRARGTE